MTRFVIARPDHIGDVTLMLPIANSIKHSLPSAHISFVVSPRAAEIPRRCTDIDEVITVPFPPTWPGAPMDADWNARVPEHAARLEGRFDVALVPNVDDPWSATLLHQARVPARFGFASPRTAPFLTDALTVRKRRHVTLLASDLLSAALSSIGAAPAGITQLPTLKPFDRDFSEAEKALESVGIKHKTKPLIVLQPGSSWPLKNWEASRWASLAVHLEKTFAACVVMTGDESEASAAADLSERSGGTVASLAGCLSLGGLAALLQRSRVLVAIDSGPFHIAGAVGCPAVGLYGPADPREFGPWGPEGKYRIVRANMPCSPCGILWDPPCGAISEPAACVAAITVEEVLLATSEIISRTEQTNHQYE